MKNIRDDFPILQSTDKPFIYVDNAATTQKPQAVLDALMTFYSQYNANVNRSAHVFAERATSMYEKARVATARFIGAQHPEEIVFTRGTTDSINAVAACWAEQQVRAGDEILITELEHHSNLLPWQRLAHKNKAHLRYIPVNQEGSIDMDVVSACITEKTKLISLTHVSNMLGSEIDIATIIKKGHAANAKIVIDAAQSMAQMPINVHDLQVDFLAFSGHKMLGPTGIGVLYINQGLHNQLEPYQVGGGMVREADFYTASWQEMPHLLEAGTPPIAQAIGLHAAIDYINTNIDLNALRMYTAQLSSALIEGLSVFDRINILGPLEQLKRTGHIVSFIVEGIHPHDVAAFLDARGIYVRAGHHCARPLARRLGFEASVRVSFYAYNTHDEVVLFLDAIKELIAKGL